jgi:hypothetical protein
MEGEEEHRLFSLSFLFSPNAFFMSLEREREDIHADMKHLLPFQQKGFKGDIKKIVKKL